jgi:hypothetical protein
MIETDAGIVILDTRLVREATDLVRRAADSVLYHHSRRVSLFGRLKARNRGLWVDPEPAYVGAMFHPGLTDRGPLAPSPQLRGFHAGSGARAARVSARELPVSDGIFWLRATAST